MSKELFHYLHLLCRHLRAMDVKLGSDMKNYMILFRSGWLARMQFEDEKE